MNDKPDNEFNITKPSGIPKKLSISAIIDYIQQQLASWRDDPSRNDALNEDDMNDQLCAFLDSKARKTLPMIRFQREKKQTGIRRSDVAAQPIENMAISAVSYTIYDDIITIECKRLPAPKQNRCNEYVTGPIGKITGGIQRYRLELHGAKHSQAVMIGYIEQESAQHWFQFINGVITNLTSGSTNDGLEWTDNDLITNLVSNVNGVSSASSEHLRMTKDRIHIHHMWINMVSDQ